MSTKDELQKIIDGIKYKNLQKSEEIIKNISDSFVKAIEPTMNKMVSDVGDAVKSALKDVKIEIPAMPDFPEIPAPIVNMPEIKFPDFPNIPAPIVNVPKNEYPEFPQSMKVEGENFMAGYSNKNPFPVMMYDAGGKPMQFSMGASGGKGDFFTIVGMPNSTATVMVDSSGVAYSGSNPLPTSAAISLPSGQGDAASATRVVIAGNSDASVVVNSGTITTVQAVTGITNSIASALVDSSGIAYSGSNPLPITGTITTTAGAVGQGDSASASRTVQAGDSSSSINILTINGNTPATGLNETNNGVLRVVQMTDSVSSTSALQAGTWNIGTVTSITNSIAAALIDSGGVQYSTSNPVPTTLATALDATIDSITTFFAGASVASVVVNSGTITTVSAVTGITNSISAALVDSTGVAYSGSNPLPTTASVSLTLPSGPGDGATATRFIQAGDSSSSINILTINGNTPATGLNETTNGVLRIVSMSDSVSSSQAKLLAHTTQPTAASDATSVFQSGDKLGRTVTRPIQIRDLISTAYVTLSTGTEATLLAASAGSFLDLISIIAVNTSTAAQQLDIRATTAGNIVQTLYIPAQSQGGWTPPVPWPQDNQGNNWTVDMADVTNSNIIITALFSKEI